MSLVRGGPKYKSIIGLDACGWQGWAVLFVHLIVSIIVCVVTANKIVAETHGLTVEQIKKYSVQVTQTNVWYFLIAGFVAGFLAGLMAIGATLILVPIWMKVGVDKDYAGNSTATLILYSSLITFSVAYINHVFEHIPYYVMVFYLVLSFVSSALVKGTFFNYHRYFSNNNKEIQIRVISYYFVTCSCYLYTIGTCSFPNIKTFEGL